MIQVIVGNNLKKDRIVTPANTTLRSALERAGVDYTRGVMHLDGASLAPGDIDKTFADFGIIKSCFLLNVAKAENA